jgi:hypothetical protein
VLYSFSCHSRRGPIDRRFNCSGGIMVDTTTCRRSDGMNRSTIGRNHGSGPSLFDTLPRFLLLQLSTCLFCKVQATYDTVFLLLRRFGALTSPSSKSLACDDVHEKIAVNSTRMRMHNFNFNPLAIPSVISSHYSLPQVLVR